MEVTRSGQTLDRVQEHVGLDTRNGSALASVPRLNTAARIAINLDRLKISKNALQILVPVS